MSGPWDEGLAWVGGQGGLPRGGGAGATFEGRGGSMRGDEGDPSWGDASEPSSAPWAPLAQALARDA